MNYGEVEERSSSQNRSPNTARRAATSAILTDILLRSDRAPTSRTDDAERAVMDRDDISTARPIRLGYAWPHNFDRNGCHASWVLVSEPGPVETLCLVRFAVISLI